MKLTDYLILPGEITPFERGYLKRINKVALIFFYLHVPVLGAVAWVSGTGVLEALALMALVLAGPTVAYRMLKNPRTLSMVYGITAMLMGGLLVHFGQGPVQVEMHFYFFALLAMLCMFANPAVNLVAAGTVTVHHLAVFLFLPSSFVNYDAEWWVVAVHAAFVVVETVAAVFISREFFDNVIGLEKIVEARTATIREQQRDMKLILDNTAQGLVTIDLEGKVVGDGSKAMRTWFGEQGDSVLLSEWIGQWDPKFGEWFDLSLESVSDGFLPLEITLGQLPKTVSVADRTYTLAYRMVEQEDPAAQAPDEERREFERKAPEPAPEKMLVMVTDVTEQLEKEAKERRQAELLELFKHINRDKPGFLEFIAEAEELMATLMEGKYEDLDQLKRLIHTLKGNSAIFGMRTFSGICHELETLIADEGIAPTDEQIDEVEAAWNDIRGDLKELLGEAESDRIQLEDSDYQAILRAVVDGADKEAVTRMIESWRLEPTLRRLEIIQKQILGLTERMGKEPATVLLYPNDIRFDSKRFAPFWSAFIHVLRNTVDHGIEDVERRESLGKPRGGVIKVTTEIADEKFVISVEDDGPGVDWDRLRERAVEMGHDVAGMSNGDLLFLSGVSAKADVSELSGRGVGMAAILEACEQLGGSIDVTARPSKGTTISFTFPADEAVYAGHSAVLASSEAA
ncbi:MAG: ATP-binding protein [Pseudomonadales bacterium]|jgi:two-component system chemotaxis sensor kinase CheA|nr:ATP-binding protein [Pseudomonadales bacterium]